MIDYSIAAIPTTYRGRTYRSRLEARWAAFFDALGIAHEYEPYDLGLWSPDFLLTEMRVLVEVKPISAIDHPTWSKMVDACAQRRLLFGSEEEGSPVNGIFLTRVAPAALKGGALEVGWIGFPCDAGALPFPARLGWVPDWLRPIYHPSLISIEKDGWRGLTPDYECGGLDEPRSWPRSFPRYAAELWAKATGAVQWEPRNG